MLVCYGFNGKVFLTLVVYYCVDPSPLRVNSVQDLKTFKGIRVKSPTVGLLRVPCRLIGACFELIGGCLCLQAPCASFGSC